MTPQQALIDNPLHVICSRTGRAYRVLAVDTDKRCATLKGKLGEFEHPWDPKVFKELGYERRLGPFEGMIELP